MAAEIAHRGPDEYGLTRSGRAVLASRRLSIIDVSASRQPMTNEAGDIHLVFNGEIYNYRELRAELVSRGHRFHSNGDTEVLVHLYEDFGADFLHRLEGQFAIAVSDTRTGTLLLARDRFGICPLFYTALPDAVHFCSEIKGLLASGAATPAVDPAAVVQVAYFGSACAPRTMIKGVRSLPPGFRLLVDHEGEHTEHWWDVTFPEAGAHNTVSRGEAAATVRHLIDRAVDSHRVADVPLSCFLSGGIDSALIGSALARRVGDPVSAFSIASTDRRLDESRDAADSGASLGLSLRTLLVDGNAIAATFPRLVWHGESPVISTEAAALLLLAREASRSSKVVLTGEGADEAFGGYLAFRQFKALGALTGRGLGAVRSVIRPLLEARYGTDCLLPPETRLAEVGEHFGGIPAQMYEWEFFGSAIGAVLADPWRDMLRQGLQWQDFAFDHSKVRNRHWLDRSLYVGYKLMLPNYLLGTHGDRVFSANSIEGRYPFLDRALVDYAASLPPSMKIRGFREKYVMRVASESWLPKSIAWRPKRRFMTPFGTPFVGPDAPEAIRRALSPEAVRSYGYCDPQRLAAAIDGLRNPPRSRGGPKAFLERLALGLAITFATSLQLWHQQFIEGAALSAPDPLPSHA